MSKRLVPLLLAFVASVAAAAVQPSLYIPGVGTEAVSASEIGVGAQGTTWLIEPVGPVTGSGGFDGAVTLVAGPSSLHFVYIDPIESVSEGCTYKDGSAICVVEYAMTGVTTVATTVTEPLSYFTVPGASTTSTPSAGSGSRSSAGAGAAQTNSPNAAAQLDLSAVFFLGVVGTAMLVLN